MVAAPPAGAPSASWSGAERNRSLCGFTRRAHPRLAQASPHGRRERWHTANRRPQASRLRPWKSPFATCHIANHELAGEAADEAAAELAAVALGCHAPALHRPIGTTPGSGKRQRMTVMAARRRLAIRSKQRPRQAVLMASSQRIYSSGRRQWRAPETMSSLYLLLGGGRFGCRSAK